MISLKDHINTFPFNLQTSDAFTKVYNECYSRISYFARRFTADWDIASDITAESFIKLWNLRADFDSLAKVEAFLYVTTRNACLNHIKSAQLQSDIRQRLIGTLEQDNFTSFFKENIEAELLERIYRKIELLPAKHQKVFKMAYLEGYKNEEIATFLKISNKTVRNQKSEALQMLRQVLGKEQLILVIALLPYCDN